MQATLHRPIDTAPKDGTVICIYALMDDTVLMPMLARWEIDTWVSPTDPEHVWTVSDDCGPTHWVWEMET